MPYLNLGNNNGDLNNAAIAAGEMVDFINNDPTNVALIGRVENWIIANEPDKNMNGSDKIGYDYNDCLHYYTRFPLLSGTSGAV